MLAVCTGSLGGGKWKSLTLFQGQSFGFIAHFAAVPALDQTFFLCFPFLQSCLFSFLVNISSGMLSLQLEGRSLKDHDRQSVSCFSFFFLNVLMTFV